MQTVAQQTKSFLSDRPVNHTSNKTAVNKEPRFRDIEYRTRSYKLIEPLPFLYHKPNVTNLKVRKNVVRKKTIMKIFKSGHVCTISSASDCIIESYKCF